MLPTGAVLSQIWPLYNRKVCTEAQTSILYFSRNALVTSFIMSFKLAQLVEFGLTLIK